MRIITGDECGLLKESIPELSRPTNINNGGNHNSNNYKEGEKQLSFLMNFGISRINNNDVQSMCRSKGVVALSFCRYSTCRGDATVNTSHTSQVTHTTHIKEVTDGNQLESNDKFHFCALRANGSLEYWQGNAPCKTREDRICGGSYNLIHTVNNIFTHHNDDKDLTSHSSLLSSSSDKSVVGRPIAMCTSLQYQQNYNGNGNDNNSNIIACCSSMGLVSILDSNQIDKGVVAHYDAYTKKSSSNDDNKVKYLKGKLTNNDIATTMTMDYNSKRIVVGGRERAATMLDVESGEKIWKAKNLPPNRQTLLQQPIWSTAIQFLSPTDTKPINGSTDLLAIGTAYKQIQIYDIRADATQRRPVLYTPEWDSNKENLFDYRITTLCQLDANKIAVGDAAGYITTVDLRKITNNSRGDGSRSIEANVGRFVGPCGSVRQIVKHQSLPIIACVGLDRMLRTYDIKSRKQLDCVYLKQRLNCLLFCEDVTWSNDQENSDGYDDEDNEESMIIDGDIDDEDEVVDYVDSSAEENASGQEENDDNYDDQASDSEQDESEDESETDVHEISSKRRKR